MSATCSGCTTRWTGLLIAHCGACHHTFTTVRAFDAHRVRGRCWDPAAVLYGPKTQRAGESLLRQNERSQWQFNEDRPAGSYPTDKGECDYFQGVGTCTAGTGQCAGVGEPLCRTMEPENGWPSQRRRKKAGK